MVVVRTFLLVVLITLTVVFAVDTTRTIIRHIKKKKEKKNVETEVIEETKEDN